MSGGLRIILPYFLYAPFKRVFWKHVNGAQFQGRWVYVWLWWRCNVGEGEAGDG